MTGDLENLQQDGLQQTPVEYQELFGFLSSEGELRPCCHLRGYR